MNFDIERLSIETPSLRMSYYAVPWDSEIFGCGVAQIDALELGPTHARDDFAPFEAWCSRLDIRFVAARLPHLSLREAGWLEAHGFRWVEMVYRPRLGRLETALVDPSGAGPVVIETATAADLPDIEAIAGQAFVTGRFQIDPYLDPALGERRYRTWVRNSFESRTQQVLKAVRDGAIAGFFIVEERADLCAYWHLTAIAPEFQGRGFGIAVWRAMIERHQHRGMTSVETTISAHNLPVMNLYVRLGFRFSSAEMTLHRGKLAATP